MATVGCRILMKRCFRSSYSSAVLYAVIYSRPMLIIDIDTCLLERNKIFANSMFLHDLYLIRQYHKTSLVVW